MYDDWSKIFNTAGDKLDIVQLPSDLYRKYWRNGNTVSESDYHRAYKEWLHISSYNAIPYRVQTYKILEYFKGSATIKRIHIEHVREGWSYIKCYSNSSEAVWYFRARIDV